MAPDIFWLTTVVPAFTVALTAEPNKVENTCPISAPIDPKMEGEAVALVGVPVMSVVRMVSGPIKYCGPMKLGSTGVWVGSIESVAMALDPSSRREGLSLI